MPKYKIELLQQLTAETVQQKSTNVLPGWTRRDLLWSAFPLWMRRPLSWCSKGIEGQYAVIIML